MLPRLAEPSDSGPAPTWPWVLIIAACCGVFAWSAVGCAGEADAPWWEMAWGMQCPSSLRAVGAADLVRLWEHGEWWRVATTTFVHGSALHLTLNMWSLWSVGPWASRAWGHARAAACFLVSSIGGILASATWAEAPLVVGASAGILGLAGALWISRGWGDATCRDRIAAISTRGLGITLALMVGLGFAVPMIAQAGHLGGLAVGAGIGVLVGGVARGTAQRTGAWLALTVVLGALAFLSRAPEWRANYFAFRGFAALDEGRDEDAVTQLREALARSDDDPFLQNGVAYGLAEAGVELDEAARLIEAALESEPENPDFLDTKGWVLCRQGRADEGLRWIRRASEGSGGGVEEIEEHLESCESAAVFHVKQ